MAVAPRRVLDATREQRRLGAAAPRVCSCRTESAPCRAAVTEEGRPSDGPIAVECEVMSPAGVTDRARRCGANRLRCTQRTGHDVDEDIGTRVIDLFDANVLRTHHDWRICNAAEQLRVAHSPAKPALLEPIDCLCWTRRWREMHAQASCSGSLEVRDDLAHGLPAEGTFETEADDAIDSGVIDLRHSQSEAAVIANDRNAEVLSHGRRQRKVRAGPGLGLDALDRCRQGRVNAWHGADSSTSPLHARAAVALNVQGVAQPADTEPAVAVRLDGDLVHPFRVGVHFLVHEQVAEEIPFRMIDSESGFAWPR